MAMEYIMDNLTIEHDIVVDLIRITMLVYNYGKNLIMDNAEDTVETFVNKLTSDGELKTLEMSDIRKEALLDIAKNVPSGKVCDFITDDDTDIQVGITINHTDKRICVVFRGSESAKDWYYDLQIMKHHLRDKIWVHSGFYKQLHTNNIYQKIADKVSSLLNENQGYQIYITGHSLGAALATLFGFLYSHETSNQITVVSFASPRVGNSGWQNAFEAKENLTHYRISNDRDIVTAFPMYKYKHVGKNIRLRETQCDFFLTFPYNSWYDYSLFRCWRTSDHDCDLYYKRLIANKW